MRRVFSHRSWLALSVTVVTVAAAVSGCGKGLDRAKKEDSGGTAGANIGPIEINSTNLAELMRNNASHMVTPTPWIGYWFPYGNAGIYSTAVKYDEAYTRGRSTDGYKSLAAWEASNHSTAAWKFEPWFGHCNGWAASAIMVEEPRQGKTINGVYFDIGDLKAMLAESWLEFSGDFVGSRVNDKGDFSSAAFWDIVPAQFHLMLANLVGKQNRALILDRHTGDEIWNQPLVAYAIDPIKPEDYLGPHPQHPEIYRVNVTARIWWANDNVGAGEISPPFDMQTLYNTFHDYFYPGRLLKYELWLDGPTEFDAAGNLVNSGDILVTQESGRYVGGAWKNAANPEGMMHSHPDYFWVPFGKQHSSGYKNPLIDDNWVRDNISPEHPRRG